MNPAQAMQLPVGPPPSYAEAQLPVGPPPSYAEAMGAGASLGNHKVSIAGLDKARVLVALYNHSIPQGFEIFGPEFLGNMTIRRARKYTSRTLDFDYVDGRVIKTDISGDVADTWLYDRDNGDDAGLRAIQTLAMPTQEMKRYCPPSQHGHRSS